MKIDENTRVTVALHFKIRNAKMFGGEGSEGFSRFSAEFAMKSMTTDNIKLYVTEQVKALAIMFGVSEDDIVIISQEEYDYEMGEDE